MTLVHHRDLVDAQVAQRVEQLDPQLGEVVRDAEDCIRALDSILEVIGAAVDEAAREQGIVLAPLPEVDITPLVARLEGLLRVRCALDGLRVADEQVGDVLEVFPRSAAARVRVSNVLAQLALGELGATVRAAVKSLRELPERTRQAVPPKAVWLDSPRPSDTTLNPGERRWHRAMREQQSRVEVGQDERLEQLAVIAERTLQEWEANVVLDPLGVVLREAREAGSDPEH